MRQLTSGDQRSALYSEVTANKLCFNCKKDDHQRRDCPYDIVCHSRQKEGHKQSDCPRDLYGNYTEDVLEGQCCKAEICAVESPEGQTPVTDNQETTSGTTLPETPTAR